MCSPGVCRGNLGKYDSEGSRRVVVEVFLNRWGCP